MRLKKFESGISAVGGMTKVHQEHVYESVTYIDTPGFADAKHEQHMVKTLKKNGRTNLYL